MGFDDAFTEDIAILGDIEPGGGSVCVAIVIGAVGHPIVGGGNDLQVVLQVVGAEVFTLGPLAERLVISDTHDGGPAVVTGVVFLIDRRDTPVVRETERVAHLVGNHFGGVFAGGFEGPADHVAIAIEGPDDGHSSGAR